MSGYMDGAQETHTSAESVGPSQDPALLDLAKRREHHSDVVLIALLRHHADEQFPVLHRCRGREEDIQMGEKQKKRRRKRETEKVSPFHLQTVINVSLPLQHQVSVRLSLSLPLFVSLSLSPPLPFLWVSFCLPAPPPV